MPIVARSTSTAASARALLGDDSDDASDREETRSRARGGVGIGAQADEASDPQVVGPAAEALERFQSREGRMQGNVAGSSVGALKRKQKAARYADEARQLVEERESRADSKLSAVSSSSKRVAESFQLDFQELDDQISGRRRKRRRTKPSSSSANASESAAAAAPEDLGSVVVGADPLGAAETTLVSNDAILEQQESEVNTATSDAQVRSGGAPEAEQLPYAELCKFWAKGGDRGCRRGDTCVFKHSLELKRLAPLSFYKKKSRSRQKNIRRDTRPANARPNYLTPKS